MRRYCALFALGLCLSFSAHLSAAGAVPAWIVKHRNEEVVVAADGTRTATSRAEYYANNESGARQIAEQSFTYLESDQELEIVEAYTLKSDGRKINVSAASVFRQTPAS